VARDDGRIDLLHDESHRHALADGAAIDMQPFVDQLGPEPHLRTFESIRRTQRRRRKHVLEIFQDDLGFAQHASVMHQRRDQATRVELQIIRTVLLPLPHAGIDEAAFPGEALFGKAQPHLLRRGRAVEMIERDHQ
jgi:hypothetical protein